MSEVESRIAPDDIPAIHNILATDFTDRYISRIPGLKSISYAQSYDPANEFCNYNQTWWQATPKPYLSEALGATVLRKLHKLSTREMYEQFTLPFTSHAPFLSMHLKEYPVAYITGHDPDLQAALSIFSAQRSLAAYNEHMGGYQKNLINNMSISHAVGTRGLAPLMIGRKNGPNIPFVNIGRLIISPHFSFPITSQMLNSGMPREFLKPYNARLKEQSIEVARASTNHPLGYFSLWAMAPGGGPDDIIEYGEHEGKKVTKMVSAATVKLLKDMGVALVPVYTSFGKKKRQTAAEVGSFVPPHLVNEAALHGIMADLAQFRRNHGENNVFYAGELC